MHLRRTAAAQDVSTVARVIQEVALVSLCKAKTKPRTISPKPMLLPFSVCTCIQLSDTSELDLTASNIYRDRFTTCAHRWWCRFYLIPRLIMISCTK